MIIETDRQAIRPYEDPYERGFKPKPVDNNRQCLAERTLTHRQRYLMKVGATGRPIDTSGITGRAQIGTIDPRSRLTRT